MCRLKQCVGQKCGVSTKTLCRLTQCVSKNRALAKQYIYLNNVSTKTGCQSNTVLAKNHTEQTFGRTKQFVGQHSLSIWKVCRPKYFFGQKLCRSKHWDSYNIATQHDVNQNTNHQTWCRTKRGSVGQHIMSAKMLCRPKHCVGQFSVFIFVQKKLNLKWSFCWSEF